MPSTGDANGQWKSDARARRMCDGKRQGLVVRDERR